jgi:hypothetical protein
MEGKYALKTGAGWVDPSFHLPEFEGHHAIYSNKFDPSGSRLLVAGGPIMVFSSFSLILFSSLLS